MSSHLVNIADRTIKPSLGTRTLVYTNGRTSDIIKTILRSDRVAPQATQDFAEHLKGDDVMQTCFNIWHFIRFEINYKTDKFGEQLVKLPAYLWDLRIGDCKSMSLFAASVLKNLGIRYKYRFVSYDRYDKTPTHVYLIVQSERGKWVILDAVYHKFHSQKKFNHKPIDLI